MGARYSRALALAWGTRVDIGPAGVVCRPVDTCGRSLSQWNWASIARSCWKPRAVHGTACCMHVGRSAGAGLVRWVGVPVSRSVVGHVGARAAVGAELAVPGATSARCRVARCRWKSTSSPRSAEAVAGLGFCLTSRWGSVWYPSIAWRIEARAFNTLYQGESA